MMQLLRYSNEPATISSLHNQKLIEINDAFLARTGYRREEVIGRSCQELGLWDEGSVARSIAEELAATGMVRCRTVRYRTKHGELRVGDFSAAIQHLGGAPSVVSFITDVTDAFLAQEEQRC